MLFPNDARLDSIAGSEKWTLKDSCTAGDVHVAVGSPSIFRLRYGWFEADLKQQSSGSSLASAHSADKTIGCKSSDLVFSEQKHMVGSGEFPSNFVVPPDVDNTNTVQAVVPFTCDSFDAAIASLIARQQGSSQPRVSNPSLWEAEETCHAFPVQNQSSKRTSSSVPCNNGATITPSILGAIPETGTDDDQCSTKGRKEEPNIQTPAMTNDHNANPEISMHESSGDPELGVSCSRLLSGTDSLGLSCLLANSLDAFQNFSVS